MTRAAACRDLLGLQREIRRAIRAVAKRLVGAAQADPGVTAMPVSETIAWQPASERPEEGQDVLAINSAGVCLITWIEDGLWPSERTCRCACHGVTPPIRWWAPLPRGPSRA